jgi:transcriptional regulator with XRE-family HTH domain
MSARKRGRPRSPPLSRGGQLLGDWLDADPDREALLRRVGVGESHAAQLRRGAKRPSLELAALLETVTQYSDTPIRCVDWLAPAGESGAARTGQDIIIGDKKTGRVRKASAGARKKGKSR